MNNKYNIGEVVVTEHRGNYHPVIIKSMHKVQNKPIRYHVAFSDKGSSFGVDEDEVFPYRKDKLDLI